MSEFIKKAIHPIVNKDKNDKVQDRFVFNGTVLEVGGNIAFESIEQLGYMGSTPTSCVVNPGNMGSTAEPTRLTGVQSVELRGKTATVDSSAECPNDGDLYGAPVGGPPSVWYNIGGIVYKVAFDFDDPDHTIKVFGNNLAIVEDRNAISEWTEGGPEFKPFFTEEQYQEILHIIG